MIHRRIAQIIALFVISMTTSACQPARPRVESGGPPQWDVDLVELVLRRQIGSSNIDLVPVRKNVYLSVLGSDATLALIDRFKNSGLQVYRASEFKPGKGVIHRIDRIENIDPRHALVDASWSQNGSDWTDYRYLLQRNGRWTIQQSNLLRSP